MLQGKIKTLPNPEHQQIAEDRKLLATFANVDFQRTRFWCLAASVAVNYPRRIPDATPRELTFDKRVSRKMCNSYKVLWSLYHKETDAPPEPEWSDWPIVHIDPLMNRIGSSVVWPRQIDYLIDVVIKRMHLLTEFDELAIEDGLRSWYNKHDMLLDWELEQLHRVRKFIIESKPTYWAYSFHPNRD